MSQENVDKLRRGYEAFKRGEYDAGWRFVTPKSCSSHRLTSPPIEVPRGFALDGT